MLRPLPLHPAAALPRCRLLPAALARPCSPGCQGGVVGGAAGHKHDAPAVANRLQMLHQASQLDALLAVRVPALQHRRQYMQHNRRSQAVTYLPAALCPVYDVRSTHTAGAASSSPPASQQNAARRLVSRAGTQRAPGCRRRRPAASSPAPACSGRWSRAVRGSPFACSGRTHPAGEGKAGQGRAGQGRAGQADSGSQAALGVWGVDSRRRQSAQPAGHANARGQQK